MLCLLLLIKLNMKDYTNQIPHKEWIHTNDCLLNDFHHSTSKWKAGLLSSSKKDNYYNKGALPVLMCSISMADFSIISPSNNLILPDDNNNKKTMRKKV